MTHQKEKHRLNIFNITYYHYYYCFYYNSMKTLCKELKTEIFLTYINMLVELSHMMK